MIREQTAETQTNGRRRTIIVILFGVAVFFGANAHLVYVAVMSQPDCVAHDKIADAATKQFRAAKPGC